MAGLNHGNYDVGNLNASTNHFVVINSMQKDGKNITFTFYDNAGTKGMVFNFNTETGKLTNSSENVVVTEIRKNK